MTDEALSEQVGVFAFAEVFEGFGGELAAAGGAVQIAGLEEEGFVHVFERGLFLRGPRWPGLRRPPARR